jgi:hypothetical protein
MKNQIKWLGIIALLAVIGLSFAACGGSEPEKTIKITGIPAEYQAATSLSVTVIERKVVSAGRGQLSGSTLTCDLYIMEQTSENSYRQTNDRWTGKGTFWVELAINIGGNYKWGRAQFSITSAVTTIPFSQLQFN